MLQLLLSPCEVLFCFCAYVVPGWNVLGDVCVVCVNLWACIIFTFTFLSMFLVVAASGVSTTLGNFFWVSWSDVNVDVCISVYFCLLFVFIFYFARFLGVVYMHYMHVFVYFVYAYVCIILYCVLSLCDSCWGA